MNPSLGDRAPITERWPLLRRSAAQVSSWLHDRTRARQKIPIRGRIALFGAGVVALAVVTFSSLVYVLVERSLITQQDAALNARGTEVLRALQSPRGFQPSRFTLPFDINKSSDIFVEITVFNPSQVYSSGLINNAEPVLPVDLLQSAPFDTGKIVNARAEKGPLMRVYVRQLASPTGPAGYLVVGKSLSGIESQLSGLRLFLVGGGLVTLLAAGAASWWLAGRALRPLDAMASTAEDIGRTQDLSRRLPESEPDDEVGRLQRSFNQMLRQLEDAYHRLQSALVAQRRFVADASHELRTPLTTIRGNVGLLLKREDITTDDRLAALNDIAGESERMSRMVQDLLTLARADAGYHLDKTPIDLLPIVQDVARQAQTLQPSRRIELLDGVPVPVQGNADAIKQLLWILIDNAFKHTHDGGRIQLRLDNGHQAARLMVVDDGPGIPNEDLERVFERFYQSDAARSGEGTGLGLAIARWIAKEHGGQVTAANSPRGGAAFTVELPVTKS
ncbi:MAG: HAMP domain-containing histidine kinase [Candidatus Dormibacteraeota bacterium]|nr:HAMP domain-containing histidine kinase [Candidatus Dormibacteraeota bacterium]